MCQPPFRCRRIDERRLRRITNEIVFAGGNFLICGEYGGGGAGVVQRGCGCDVRMGARQRWTRPVRLLWSERRRSVWFLEFPRSLVPGCGHQRTDRDRRSNYGKLIDLGFVFGRGTLQASATMVRRET